MKATNKKIKNEYFLTIISCNLSFLQNLDSLGALKIQVDEYQDSCHKRGDNHSKQSDQNEVCNSEF